jgi:hypothetical protein
MASRTLQFLAVILTALAFVPSGAHLAELPGKIGLSGDAYFTVQGIYRGWALFGAVWIAALLADLVLAIGLRHRRSACVFAAIACLCVAAAFLVFFTWTFPANQITQNWTSMPENWAQLRTEWEYSHAATAVLLFVALCSVTLATLTARD